MNRKHFIIYYHDNKLIQTTPKNWARNNKKEFPKHNFEDSDNTPTTEAIENYLINQYGFKILADSELVICYKLN